MASFSQSYPTIARWIEEQGWIEIGADEFSTLLIRVLDPGGLVWEIDSNLDSIDDALNPPFAFVVIESWYYGTRYCSWVKKCRQILHT